MAFHRRSGFEAGARRWPRLVIAFAIASLTVSLVTRYAASATWQVHLVQCAKDHPVDSQRQHLDKDAVSWISPASSVSVEAVPVLFSQVIPAPPLWRHVVLGESLYFRPPPQ